MLLRTGARTSKERHAAADAFVGISRGSLGLPTLRESAELRSPTCRRGSKVPRCSARVLPHAGGDVGDVSIPAVGTQGYPGTLRSRAQGILFSILSANHRGRQREPYRGNNDASRLPAS